MTYAGPDVLAILRWRHDTLPSLGSISSEGSERAGVGAAHQVCGKLTGTTRIFPKQLKLSEGMLGPDNYSLDMLVITRNDVKL